MARDADKHRVVVAGEYAVVFANRFRAVVWIIIITAITIINNHIHELHIRHTRKTDNKTDRQKEHTVNNRRTSVTVNTTSSSVNGLGKADSLSPITRHSHNKFAHCFWFSEVCLSTKDCTMLLNLQDKTSESEQPETAYNGAYKTWHCDQQLAHSEHDTKHQRLTEQHHYCATRSLQQFDRASSNFIVHK